MLYGLLVTVFALVCILLILLILIQKGKSSMGLGNLGGTSQLLFGGSGGQDILQKTTWVLGAIFMAGSLFLAVMKRPSSRVLEEVATTQTPVRLPVQSQTPVIPTTPTTEQPQV